MGCGVTLAGLLCLSLTAAGSSTYGRDEIAYIADPVGNALPRPSKVPISVGSPAHLVRPDRYEFYTFDETGELIKRLMTLDEIQQIIATGEGDDGHLLTVAHADLTKRPSSTAQEYGQTASNLKVHSIVDTVQNVLKAEMEAQKANPPKKPDTFDTPDVSDSWSMILPAIFGNTGGNIAPDSAIVSSHIEPETDVISEAIGKPQDDEQDDDAPSKDAEDILLESELLDDKVKLQPSTVNPLKYSSNLETKTGVYLSSTTEVTTPKIASTPAPTQRTTTATPVPTQRTTVTQAPTKATTYKPIKIESKTTTTARPSSTTVSADKIVGSSSATQSIKPVIINNELVNRTSESYTSSTTPRITIRNNTATTTERRPVSSAPTYSTSTTIKESTIEQKPTAAAIKSTTEIPKISENNKSSTPLSTTTSKPTTVSSVSESTTQKRTPITTASTKVSENYNVPSQITTTERAPSTTTKKIEPSTTEEHPVELLPQLNIGEIISQIASDLQDPSSTPSYVLEKTSSSEKYVPSTTQVPSTSTTTTTIRTTTTTTSTTTAKPNEEKRNPTTVASDTEKDVSSSTTVESFVKIIPIIKNTSTSTTESIETTENSPTTQEAMSDDIGDEYLDDYLETTTTIDVTKPNIENELSDSITELISQIVDDSKQTSIPSSSLQTSTTLKSPVVQQQKVNKTNPIKDDTVPTTYRPLADLIKVISSSTTSKTVYDTSTKRATVTIATTTTTEKASENYSESTTASTTPLYYERDEEDAKTTTTIYDPENEYETTTDTGITDEDSELMEMLSQVSQIFQISPKVESKSDDSLDVEHPLSAILKKPTAYKKTDEEEIKPTLQLKIGTDQLDDDAIEPTTIVSISTTKNVPTLDNSNITIKNESPKKDSPIRIVETVTENSVSVTKPFQNESKISEVNEPTVAALEKNTNASNDTRNDEPTLIKIPVTIKPENDSNSQEEIDPNYEKTTEIYDENIETTSSFAEFQTTPSETNHKSDVKLATEENILKEKSTERPGSTTEKISSISGIKIENLIREKDAIAQVIKSTGAVAGSSTITPISEPTTPKDKNDKILPTLINKPSAENDWKLVSSTIPDGPNDGNHLASKPPHFQPIKENSDDGDAEPKGLELTTRHLSEDVKVFTQLCNELAFRYWNHATSNLDIKRSVVTSPFAVISLLSMIFLGARGATSGEMNDILKLDDMVTFNPHVVFRNVTESIEVSKRSGVATSAFVRELFTDRAKGRLLSFYRDRVQQFYGGYVEEINFGNVADIVRRRTNLLVKRHSWEKIPEYIKSNNMVMRPPMSVFAANIFQTDCTAASTEGRDGEMSFIVSPAIRQRKLVLVPAVLYRSGFLAGYVPELDATIASIGGGNQVISTILAMPGQLGSTAQGDHILELQKRLVESEGGRTWSKVIRSLRPRDGLELQVPRFSHRSVENATESLVKMGLRDLFTPGRADLRGLNGVANDLHVSDMMMINTFSTCGEGVIADQQHHVEVYPGEPNKNLRRLWRTQQRQEAWEEPRDYQRAFHDPLHDSSYLSMPLHLRPRQARLPENVDTPRLKFDRPFMFFIRHNPTGLILYMGRYNPRLLP